MIKKMKKEALMMRWVSLASLSVAFTLIILKGLAFLWTGSVAILSGLFDSVQDLMTSAVNMIAVHQATAPADKEHRFGHGKAQAVGSLIQACIIASAAFFLMIEAIERFNNPKTLERIGAGIWVTVTALILTIILVRVQAYVVKKTGSLSIKADQAHYNGDILMNIGILISMAGSYYFNYTRLDALFGMGVSLYLCFVVYQVIKESIKMLMDSEMPEEFREQIKEIAHSFPAVIKVHDLKTRQSGSNVFVQFCVHFEETMTLRQAHDISDMIEDRIKEKFPDTEIIIHQEPERIKNDI